MDAFANRATATTVSVSLVSRSEFKAWVATQSKSTKAWFKSLDFAGETGRVAQLSARDGKIARILIGTGKESASLWHFARAAGLVPGKGSYTLERLEGKKALPLDEKLANAAALGWGLARYSFDRYKKSPSKRRPKLVWPEAADKAAVTRTLEATYLVRDLINTPASDMGPAELAEAASELAAKHEAEIEIIEGEALLDENYPAVHAVGRGSERAPRLIDIRWGDPDAPKVSVVGKGVVFDSGGLDLKSAGGMKLMKKDMGGGAHALGLAHMIMDAKLPVRLRVLVPAVENGVAGDAMRPLDVLNSRKGITIEVGNTDAEGRLILCDALAEADSEDPELLIDFATLTGAARVAVGTEIAALFTDDEALAADLLAAAKATRDTTWRLPLHRPYRRYLDSKVADINNIASVGTGGAITAALFLSEFVSRKRAWAHFDIMGWNAQARVGRPVGGEAMGLRASFEMLRRRYAPESDAE